MSKIYAFGFVLAMAVMPIGAFYKPAIFGAWLATPAAPIFFLLALLKLCKLTFRNEDKYILFFLVWVILLSIPSLLMFGVSSFYFTKSVSNLIFVLSWLSPLLLVPKLSPECVKLGIALALGTLFFGFVVIDLKFGPTEFIQGLLVAQEFHFIDDSRPNGLNSESSHFSAQLGRLVFAYYLLHEAGKKYSTTRFTVFLFIFGFLMLLTGSKGAFVSVLFVAASTLFSLRTLILSFAAMLITFQLIPDLIKLVSIDLQNFTSLSTRGTLFFIAIIALMNNPLGYGIYGTYPVISYFGPIAIDNLPNIPLNLSEIYTIVFQLESVSFKSTLLDLLVIGGVAFLLLLKRALSDVDLKDPRVISALFYLLASGLYVEGPTTYSFFVLLSVIRLAFKKERTT